MPTWEVLARTLRGIEWIAQDEVRSRLAIDDVAGGHRELRFVVPSLSEEVLSLGTVDDVFLVVAEVDGVTRRRQSLAELASLSLDLDGVAGYSGGTGRRRTV
jgi:tRNA (guanine6-N2)-methyltransferase